MNEIEQSLKAGVEALKGSKVLKDVAKAMVEGIEPAKPQATVVPLPVPMTGELKEALAKVYLVFGSVNIDEPRVLSEQENRALLEENRTLNTIAKAIADRLEATKDLARINAHQQAMADGFEGEEVDQYGHALVARKGEPQRVNVPGTGLAWSLEYRSPSMGLDASVLLEAYENGDIDRETYLSFTREKRVFDEDKALQAIRKDPSKLRVLRKMISLGRPGTALNVRKAK